MTTSISCVIPTHARPHLLVEALASVAAQTHVPDEIVVVSDTPDESMEQVCASFAEGTNIPVRVIVYSDHPGGASESRNRGVMAASSDWIAFLDDDDTWQPDFLERALEVAESRGVPLVVAWITMFHADTRRNGPAIAPGLTPAQVVAVNAGTTGSNMIMLRSAFDEVGGFDPGLRMKNDTDFFYRFVKAGFGYAVVPERLVNQRKHDSGQLTGHSAARADNTQKYLDKHRADLTLGDRRKLGFVIHRIRRHSAPTAPRRVYHLVMALLHYSPRQFVIDRRNRGDRDYFAVPALKSD